MDQFNVYKDMKARTNGEIYIGVVGPVRTGKSTFIKRFMNLMVLPNIEDENDRNRANDELPQYIPHNRSVGHLIRFLLPSLLILLHLEQISVLLS